MFERGQGNPFFTTELVEAHLAGQTIPAVLSDLIADLAELDDTGRQVLGVIAAIGHDTDHDLLLRVAEVDDDRLEAALRAAIAAQLLVVDPETDACRFRPRADRGGRVCRAAPTTATTPSRADRHHLAEAGSADPDESRSGQRARIPIRPGICRRRSALLAAADAAETVAPGAALHHLERAFELWELPDPRPTVSVAVIGCGRRPNWPAGRPATRGPPALPARRSVTDRRRGVA